MRRVDEIHLTRPFLETRRIREELCDRGWSIYRKQAGRLMRQMGLRVLYARPRTAAPGTGHVSYPYRLKGMIIDRPNQVWVTDIWYLPMVTGFMYLVAIMDWHTRKVLSWRLSNTMDTAFCVETLEEALRRLGGSEIFNTDKGRQFTSETFTGVVKAHEITTSMDGNGRWIDNVFVEHLWRTVKYEDVYLRAYKTRKKL